MTSKRVTTMTETLSRRLDDGSAKAASDDVLLTAFVDRQDTAAFAELVQRHGPMV